MPDPMRADPEKMHRFYSQIKTELALPPDPVLLEGWSTPARGIEMAELILETKPDVVVELGVFGGRSLIAQALALKFNGRGMIYGIDPWKTEAALEGENQANQEWWAKVDLHQMHKATMEAVWRLELEPFVTIIRQRSEHCAMLFGNADIISIDGNHSEVASCRDVTLYAPLLAPGGYIWMDDTNWESTRKAMALLEDWCVLVSDFGDHRLYKRR